MTKIELASYLSNLMTCRKLFGYVAQDMNASVIEREIDRTKLELVQLIRQDAEIAKLIKQKAKEE